jgi:hypothetical protein
VHWDIVPAQTPLSCCCYHHHFLLQSLHKDAQDNVGSIESDRSTHSWWISPPVDQRMASPSSLPMSPRPWSWWIRWSFLDPLYGLPCLWCVVGQCRSSSIMIFTTQQVPQTLFYEQINKYFALKWNAWQRLTVRKATSWLIYWTDQKECNAKKNRNKLLYKTCFHFISQKVTIFILFT